MVSQTSISALSGSSASVMKKVLSDHDCLPNSICRHPDENVPPHMLSESLASHIMEPARGVMHLATGNPCRNDYEEYSL